MEDDVKIPMFGAKIGMFWIWCVIIALTPYAWVYRQVTGRDLGVPHWFNRAETVYALAELRD
jgi:hypothetical protein